MKKLLIIGYVWPEPKTTGAGVRMMQLIHFFIKNDFQITFTSTAEKTEYSEDLNALGVTEKRIKLNDSSFDIFIKEENPDAVLFDRFYTEEQFGWRVAEICSDAMRILDTEDLHFLRKSREETVKNVNESPLMLSDIAKRELASVYRCDLSLIISEAEIKILREHFKIDESLLFYLPFLPESTPLEKETLPGFEERNHFIFIGNYKHQPNVNTVLELKNKIWPLMSEQLPEAELHIYGAYASDQIKQLHKPRERFFIKGWVEDAELKIKNARVMLSPLRFGAGLKGKLIQSMQCGTPSVTTSIGAEGINSDLPWNGFVEDNTEIFVEKAIALYLNKELWKESQHKGFQILYRRFNSQKFSSSFFEKLQATFSQLKMHRQFNFIGSLLMHHTLQSSKYLSKWIEEKNK
tara:strand:+ start:29057 stop:30277 length:1221 start_codon:yes stop_codon:yes gene_type:complete